MPPLGPDDARQWARRLESARAASAKWDLARFARTDSLIYLVIDGLYSTSIGPGHWSSTLVDRPDVQQLPGTLRAFSYAGYGEHYLPAATAESFRVLLARWNDCVARLLPHQRLIPVCFSLGAAVTLLGLQRWAASPPAARAGEIAAAVLVAPAYAPAPALLDGYLQVAGELAPYGIPASIRELCSPGSLFRTDAQASLRTMPHAGIPLHVIFWPADLLTPYQASGRPEIDERPVLIDKPLLNTRDAVKEHMGLRGNGDVLSAIVAVLKGYP